MRKIFTLFLLCSAMFSQAQCPQFLSIDTSICNGPVNITADASVLKTQLCGDSITILFNAAGTSLAGDTNVYFHSGPEFRPFAGWAVPFTVGHWGLNDGVGRMTSVGTNLWAIRINPRTYYNYSVDSCLNGVFMDFRNFNGNIKASDNGNDIYLYTAPGTPTSTYAPIQGTTETHNTNVTYLWSDGNTSSSRIFTTTQNLTVTATGIGNCTASGSVVIKVGHAPVSLGNDIVQCSRTSTTITASPGFATYKWLNAVAGNSNAYTATNPGPYWVKATDSVGCVSNDTVNMHFSDVLGLSIPDTLRSCPGSIVAVNANTSIEQNGDSLVIIYDATTGQTGLIGAQKIYMHSGPEFHSGSGWQGNYTIGNYGQDDGVGKMDSLGNNHWRIAIDLRTYYHVNPDTPITGIYMIFRNANGTQTGKDGNGNNIYVALNGPVPVSQFFGVYAFKASSGNVTYSWSNGSSAASTTFNTTGAYTLTVSDSHGCSKSATVQILFNNTLSVNLGHDTTICNGDSLNLTAGAGYTSYSWSSGATTNAIRVAASGSYTVTVTNGTCSATSSINVTVHTEPISIGANIVRCNLAPVTLTASTGFNSYHWFGATASSQTFSATNAGSYWVKGIDASGCSSYDTITVTNSSVLGLQLTDSFVSCGNDTIHLNAATSINAKGDSLTIVYNAALGQTGLLGATKVYMHSSAQTYTGSIWGSITVGNWGMDDGIGEMTSLGNNMWTITIDPRNYYVLSPDTQLLGIFIVFRNANGSATGKDVGGGNILLNLTGNAPTSTFAGITGIRKASVPLTFNWSDGETTSAVSITAGGTYILTVSDTHSCSISDTVTVIQGQSVGINLGSDTSICADSLLTLNVGSGFASYVWSTGASTPYLYVSSAGTYSVTVTNNAGCTGHASIVVSSSLPPTINLGHDTTNCNPVVISAGAGFSGYDWSNGATSATITVSAAGSYSVTVTASGGCKGTGSITIDSCVSVVVTGCGSPTANFSIQSIDPGNTVTFHDRSSVAKVFTYQWSFGDGVIFTDTGSSTGSVVHTYPSSGNYTVTLVVRDSCGGVDTFTKQINVNVTGIASVSGISAINLFPNPNKGAFNIEINTLQPQVITFVLFNQLGQQVLSQTNELAAGQNSLAIHADNFASGIYLLEILGSNEKAVKKITITK